MNKIAYGGKKRKKEDKCVSGRVLQHARTQMSKILGRLIYVCVCARHPVSYIYNNMFKHSGRTRPATIHYNILLYTCSDPNDLQCFFYDKIVIKKNTNKDNKKTCPGRIRMQAVCRGGIRTILRTRSSRIRNNWIYIGDFSV